MHVTKALVLITTSIFSFGYGTAVNAEPQLSLTHKPS